MSHIQDLQDAVFFQIIESIKVNDLQNINELTKRIGDCSNKIQYYSHVLRDLFTTLFGPHHVNDDVGKFCSFLFQNGLSNASYFIYCLASHDHYVNGFSFGFIRNYVYDHWCYLNGTGDKFLELHDRDINKLRELFSMLDTSQITKATENIHHIIHHLSVEQFMEIMMELKNYEDFLISEVTPQFIIELLSHKDDKLIEFIIFEILNENHNEKKKTAKHFSHKSILDNFEIGLVRINYILVETLKILYGMYNHYLTLKQYPEAERQLLLGRQLISVILNIFENPNHVEKLFICNLYESLEKIKSWNYVIDSLKDKVNEIKAEVDVAMEQDYTDFDFDQDNYSNGAKKDDLDLNKMSIQSTHKYSDDDMDVSLRFN